MFGDLPIWKAVPEVERREIFVDCQHNLAKKEKEAAKALRKKNSRRLADILDRMTAVKFNTTWEQVRLSNVWCSGHIMMTTDYGRRPSRCSLTTQRLPTTTNY